MDAQKTLIKQLQGEIKLVKENEKKQKTVVDGETKSLEELRKSLHDQQDGNEAQKNELRNLKKALNDCMTEASTIQKVGGGSDF